MEGVLVLVLVEEVVALVVLAAVTVLAGQPVEVDVGSPHIKVFNEWSFSLHVVIWCNPLCMQLCTTTHICIH